MSLPLFGPWTARVQTRELKHLDADELWLACMDTLGLKAVRAECVGERALV